MSAHDPVPVPEGGLELVIDRIVVRGAGPVSGAALEAAVARSLGAAFAVTTGPAPGPGDARRLRTSVDGAAISGADGIAGAISAAVAGHMRGGGR